MYEGGESQQQYMHGGDNETWKIIKSSLGINVLHIVEVASCVNGSMQSQIQH